MRLSPVLLHGCFHFYPTFYTCITYTPQLLCSDDLTWRDVQYLIVYTSNPTLTNTVNNTAIINGAGLQVSRHYGFGVMDAEAMVTRARHWVNVPPQVEQYVIPAIDSG